MTWQSKVRIGGCNICLPVGTDEQVLEALIAEAREQARLAKLTHEEAATARRIAQREVNDLLARKATWNEADVTRFTALVREDHASEQALISAAQATAKTDEAVDQAFNELLRCILARYHEEQIWSDKIRRAGSMTSAAVIAMNMLVFVAAVIFVEPWKRRRMVEAFEERVERMDASNREAIDAAVVSLSSRKNGLGSVSSTFPANDSSPNLPASTGDSTPVMTDQGVMPIVIGVAVLGSIIRWLWLMP